MVEFTAVLDLIGVAGFVGATVFGFLNYRDADAESAFWLCFMIASLLGVAWTGAVLFEWLGINPEFFDPASVPLMAATVGVFAVGGTATLAVVEDVKEMAEESERKRREAEQAREEAEKQREQALEQQETAEQARQEAAAREQELEALTEDLERTAEQFGTVMARAAEGDFTQRMDADVESDALRNIATSYNEMMDTLSGTLGRVERFTAAVDDAADDLSASAEEIRDAGAEVSENVEEIAANAEHQNENVTQVANEMTDFSATIEEIASSTDEVAQKSQTATELGADGREYIADTKSEMEAIERQAKETIGSVESLDEEMEQIGEIVGLIEDIAEQTNILALNASIEAARAGEAGEGFAVVADEIKGLAQETSEATQDIASRIAAVQEATAESVDGIHRMDERVTNGMNTVDETMDVLADILEHIEEVNDGIQSVDAATDEQASSTEEVVSMVEEVGELSEETSTGAQTAAAAAEEQTASLETVVDGILGLADDARELGELMQEFELDRGATDATPTVDTTLDGGANTDAAADGGTRSGRSDGDRPSQ